MRLSLFLAALIVVATPALAQTIAAPPAPDKVAGQSTGDIVGLDILPLENQLFHLENIKKTYDPNEPVRLIAVSARSAAAPRSLVNYFHSILLSKGWQSQGVVSSNNGATLIRGNELITIRPFLTTQPGAANLAITLTDIAPVAPGPETTTTTTVITP